jgi:hypothetical protein
MRRLFLVGFALSSGCFLFQSNNCQEVGCDSGFTCQAFFDEFECVQTCGDGFFDSEFEECDASDSSGGGSACNELCELRIAEGCGDGVEQPGAYCLGAEIFPPIAGNVDAFSLVDFDSDGDDDLIARSETRFDILFNSGAGFDTPPVFAFSSANLFDVAADVNGDGLLDIITTQSIDDNTRRITPFLQGANLSFSPGATQEIPISHRFVELNNDGNLDLIVDSDISSLSVLFGDGAGGFSLSQTLSADIKLLFGGGLTFSDPEDLFRDWDGDGDIDLIAQRGSELLLFQNQGGALSESGVIGTLETAPNGSILSQKFSVRDWDNDGDLDLMIGTATSGFTLLRNNAGVFTVQTTSTNRTDLSNGAVGDFNGDGLPDILAVFISESLEGPLQYSIFENDGSGQLVAASVNEINTSVLVRAKDFNSDGRDDAHFLGTTADAVVLFDGATFLEPQFLDTIFLDTYSDLNGDGFLDLVRVLDNRIIILPGAAD